MEKECQNCHKKYNVEHERINRLPAHGYFCSPLCRNLYLGRTVKKTCETCNKDFYLRTSYFKNGEHLGRFCSKECYDIWQRKEQKISQCKYCGKDIIISARNRHTNNNTFCDRTCYSKYRQRDQYGKFIDGEISGIKHRPLAFDYYQINECSICGYNKFTDILQVHHKDGNKLNNDPNNLEILCPNCHCEKHLQINKKKCLLEKIECN